MAPSWLQFSLKAFTLNKNWFYFSKTTIILGSFDAHLNASFLSQLLPTIDIGER